MAIFDAAAFAAGLKIVYGDQIIALVGEKLVALPLFGERNAEEWGGLRVQETILVGRGQSFMAMGSLGQLPTPQNESTFEMQIPITSVRGRIMFETTLMKQSMRSKHAYIQANTLQMQRLVANLVDEKERMLSAGTGTGTLCLVDGAGSGTTTLSVDAPAGIAADGFGARFLQPGMIIAITNGTVIHSVRQIVSILTDTATGATVQLDQAVSATDAPDDAFVVRAANLGVTNLTRDTSYNNEPMGIPGIVDNGSLVNVFHNINRTNVPDFQGTVISVTTLSLDALQRLEDTIDQQAQEKVTDWFTHHSARRAYLALVDTGRTLMQTGSSAQAFDIGQAEEEATYNGRPIRVSRDAIIGDWYGLNKNWLSRYVLTPGEWADEDGSILSRLPGQDAYEAMYRSQDNFSTAKGNAHGKLTGINVSSAIVRHVP